MADSTTTILGKTKPEVGASNNTWGTKLNANEDVEDKVYRDEGGDLTTGGTTTAYTVTPAHTGYVGNADGLHFAARFTTGANTTTTPTLAFNGFTAKVVRKMGESSDEALVAGDIGLNVLHFFTYIEWGNSGGGAWLLLNPCRPLQQATATEFWAGTATDRFPPIDHWWAAHRDVTLTDAATIAWDMSTGINFAVLLAGDRTLGFPTNITDGKRGHLRLQASGGGRALTVSHANFRGDIKDNPIAGSAPASTISLGAGRSVILDYHALTSTYVVLSSPASSYVT